MKNYILFLLFISFSIHLSGQQFSSTDPDYIKFVKAGEAALNAEKYDSCLVYYKDAFQIKQTSILSTLRGAACAYSAGNKEILDQYLSIAFELNWDQTKMIFDRYEEFRYLDETAFETRIQTEWEKGAIESGINLTLMAELNEIAITDQLQRKEMRGVREKFGWQSPQMDSLWKLQNISDSLNLNRIEEIIAEYGYPGPSLVGPSAASTAFMVIQHSNQEKQEQYLPMLKEQADKGALRWSSVALMIDRVLLGKGEKQIYGSQIFTDQETGEYYFGEIETPLAVDSIRATVGLGPLQEYADHWNFTWDADKHISRHKKIKEKKAMAEKKED
ncbi:MAG: hypothetical protein P1U56_13840 [Saprospiraceae bacterium]|nr:hypothetical protein [Saprospiraceae bacterium]